ncbi:MAG: VWA domain-containing protein, partial [Gammaproteobacteria bacterium]|nr:VWA domain-containing protein [Gammaproteobacteria bacterium]
MKNRLSARFTAALVGFCYALTAGFPALADDTEIFFGTAEQAAAGAGRYPNVLFILDTSGSMRTEVGDTNETRMQHMQEALTNILNNTTDVNVGLMRFNDPGGPILFPVSNIAADLSTVTPTASENSISSRILDSTDDAEEQGGSVNLNSARLEAVYIGGDTGTVASQISIGGDDAEEVLSNNNVSLGGNRININNNQINGFRFNNTGIPQGASISSATLSLTSRTTSDAAMTLRLYGELSNDALAFSSASGNLSSRTKTTSYVDWTPDAWTSNGVYTSQDISSVVQELVNQSGWMEDDLVLLQTFQSGSGERQAYTYNSNDAKAATLNVTYQMGTPGQQTIGLRFRDVGIPQGAEITGAVIEFTAAQSTDKPFITGLTVQGLDSDDSETFTATTTNITGRTGTTATVNWTPDAWADGDVVQTSDLKTIVQEIVDRSGWCGNNAMGFRISGEDLVNRVAHSVDGNPDLAPVLRVTYDDSALADGEGCMNQTLLYRINGGDDDAEEPSNGNVITGSDVFDMKPSQTNGLLFRNIMLKQGATVISATLELTAESSATTSTAITLAGEAADNANGFVRVNSNISSRSTTTESVSWNPGEWVRNNRYETPELKSIIEAIVGRDGWQPGNDLAIIQTAGSGGRDAFTYDNQPADAALLKIKVQSSNVAASVKKTVRNRLIEIVNEFVPSGFTPIVDTLYEAANYYRGGDVLYGKSRGAQTTYGRVSHPDSYTGGTVSRADGCTDDTLNSSACSTEAITGSPKYKTPILDACQTNHIVLLTDGEANHNNSISLVKALTGDSSCNPGSGGEACGRELAKWMATSDQHGSLTGDQIIKTYTIGFNLDNTNAISFMEDLAREGEGNYYSASTADQLTAVFQNIFRSILDTDTTFVSPGATVNQFNRLTHLNDIYFSVFKPDTGPQWSGNLKRYEIKGNPAIIVDSNDNPAVDAATGFFANDSKSFWSSEIDGNKVDLGGAAAQLTDARNIYTYTGTSNNLKHPTNKVTETNAALDKTLLGIENKDDEYHTKLLKWASGVDVKNWDGDEDRLEPRLQIGAPLHSQAVVITYGGTSGAQENVVFLGTNEGYLHAIDTSNGTEKFAFIPPELLPNLSTFYDDIHGVNLPYGLDGPITYWVKDVNGDHIITADEGDYVYLYVAMRRGGRQYYALDVTDPDAPEFKWSITGGSGDFAELGQTWSSAVKTAVNINGTVKQVLIFSGGYDSDQDDKSTRSPDTQGRALFIVDAETGDMLWSAGPATDPSGDSTQTFADMNYSIPADIRVIDINNDGLADQMYAADMGGQLWRFDINNGSAASSLVSGGVIADLALNASGENDAANNRRFYYAPDVSILRNGTQKYLAIALGSGWRAHPLDTVVQDRFYMIRSSDVYSKPSTYTKINESNLFNATDNTIGQGGTSEQAVAEASLWGTYSGWYMDLPNSGEKVLAESLTVNNQILFTSFEPIAGGSACSAGTGKGRLYIVSAYDATPVLNLDETGLDSELTASDRSKDLARVGIPPKPSVLFPDDPTGKVVPDPVLCVGAECGLDLDFGQIMERTFW